MDPNAKRRSRLSKAGVGRCVLEERLAQLLAATDIANLDLSAFYTPEQLARMLRCDPRTLERRRDQELPPVSVSMGKMVRYPANFFWWWVADEIVARFGSFLDLSREPSGRS